MPPGAGLVLALTLLVPTSSSPMSHGSASERWRDGYFGGKVLLLTSMAAAAGGRRGRAWWELTSRYGDIDRMGCLQVGDARVHGHGQEHSEAFGPGARL